MKDPAHILVVDDTPHNVKLLADVLVARGYTVSTAGSGKEALDKVATDGPDLVLLDVVMPELGGPETWERMRGMREGLRVLFMSGYADEQYRRRLPPDAELIEKPFRPEDLLTLIRKTLDG